MIAKALQFHEQEAVIAGAQSAVGKGLLLLVGVAALSWHEIGPLMIGSFVLVMFFPERRRSLLMLAGFGWIAATYLGRQGIELLHVVQSLDTVEPGRWFRFFVQSLAATGMILTVIFAAIRFDALPGFVRRHPLLILHLLVWLAVDMSAMPYLSMLGIAPFFLWRASYLVKSAARGNTAGTSLQDHMFYMAPVFGGPHTPFGKGLDYLNRYEATTLESIARSQLAGIKLLLLAMVWTVVLVFMSAVIFGYEDTFLAAVFASWSLELPHLAEIMLAETEHSIAVLWSAVYLELVRMTLNLAIYGHVIIGCLRLLGFNVFRNTYKPLRAESIVEFWNRYFYYFKELLVDFFFYPTFLRCTWAGPRLRLCLAAFAAAFVGNMYLHIISNPGLLVQGQLSVLWTTWGPRSIYCFLLALGIWLSMLRQQRRRKLAVQSSGVQTIRAIAGVWTFYALINIWNVTPRDIGFSERWRFMLSLLGI